MANTRFQAMKDRSGELNRKMQEIRWCISTMNGILAEASTQYRRDDSKNVRVELGFEERRRKTYFVQVGYHSLVHANIIISNSVDEVSMNPREDWWYPEIDLIHDNLDTIIGACEKFCVDGLGLAAEVAFRVQMDRFGMK